MLHEGQVGMVQIKAEKTCIEICLVARYQHTYVDIEKLVQTVTVVNKYKQLQNPLCYTHKYGHPSPGLEYTWISTATAQTVNMLHDIFTKHGFPE